MKITITDDGTSVNTSDRLGFNGSMSGNGGFGGYSNPSGINPDLIKYIEYIEQIKRAEVEKYLNYIRYAMEMKKAQEQQQQANSYNVYQQPQQVFYPNTPMENKEVVMPEANANEGLAYSIGKTIPRLIDIGKETIGNLKRGYENYKNKERNVNDLNEIQNQPNPNNIFKERY